jgi:hypothetical protein
MPVCCAEMLLISENDAWGLNLGTNCIESLFYEAKVGPILLITLFDD